MHYNEQIALVRNCRERMPSIRNVNEFLELTAPASLESLHGDELRQAKQRLVACLPHAVVGGGRSARDVVSYANRVQLDIDAASNPHLVGVLDQVGAYFAALPWCEMVGRSASGRGVCVWVRTGDCWSRSVAEAVVDYVEDMARRDGWTILVDRVNSVSPVALRFVLREVYSYRPNAEPLWT